MVYFYKYLYQFFCVIIDGYLAECYMCILYLPRSQCNMCYLFTIHKLISPFCSCNLCRGKTLFCNGTDERTASIWKLYNKKQFLLPYMKKIKFGIVSKIIILYDRQTSADLQSINATCHYKACTVLPPEKKRSRIP